MPTEGFAQAIALGYGFDGPVVELGAGMQDGSALPKARVRLPLAMLNRHGLVAGATGTGKTKSLSVMAEQLSAAGVPTFKAFMVYDFRLPDERLEAAMRIAGRNGGMLQVHCEIVYAKKF